MTGTYTKGPWEIVEDLGMDEAWCNWHKVGPFHLMGSKANADSRLIAAAPELFEALTNMVGLFGKREGDDDELLPSSEQDYEVAQALNAIAKARGEA